MANYKVESVNTGCDSVRISKDWDSIDLNVPGLCGSNRDLDFSFSGDTLTITDNYDSGFKLMYDLSEAGYGGVLNPL